MKYKVEIQGTYGTEFEIEADNEEQASDKALELFEDLSNISGYEMYPDITDIKEINE